MTATDPRRTTRRSIVRLIRRRARSRLRPHALWIDISYFSKISMSARSASAALVLILLATFTPATAQNTKLEDPPSPPPPEKQREFLGHVQIISMTLIENIKLKIRLKKSNNQEVDVFRLCCSDAPNLIVSHYICNASYTVVVGENILDAPFTTSTTLAACEQTTPKTDQTPPVPPEFYVPCPTSSRRWTIFRFRRCGRQRPRCWTIVGRSIDERPNSPTDSLDVDDLTTQKGKLRCSTMI